MRLGLFMMPLHPPTRTLGAFLEETAEKALLAERLGFDEVWLGEHFSATSEPIPSPLMFMASLVPQTKRITFATGVINLPNRHPAVIAAEVAQFDHMSEGRFIFGIGTGSLPSDYELFDIADAGQRQRMMLESISFIERIWAQGPPYELNGEFWRFAIKKAISEPLGIGIMPKPRRVGGPPICVAVSSPGSLTARIAGARGWGPVTSGLTSVDAAASHWQLYEEGCREAGRVPDGADWRVVKYVHGGHGRRGTSTGVQRASAYRYAFGYLYEVLKRAGRLVGLKTHPEQPDSDVTVESVIEARVIHGSPQTVAEKLLAFRQQVGPFGHVLVTRTDWGGPNREWRATSRCGAWPRR
jgi:alkanesulfonate monooxygenase SsuD/methylene tetrahydromethanopterin reductase-like flavin-dependent oxidoreductase (luciferase family)